MTETPNTGRAANNSTPKTTAAPTGRTVYDVIIVGIVLVGVMFVTSGVTANFKPTTASDTVAILGVVIPAIVAMGTAVFGIQYAGKAGEAAAAAKTDADNAMSVAAQARREADAASSDRAAQADAAAALKPELEALRASADRVTGAVETVGVSSSSSRSFRVMGSAPEQTADVQQEDIATMRERIARIQGGLDTIIARGRR